MSFRPRIIPVLLLQDSGLVKTIQFTNSRYIGDPINAVRIFNEKEADELIFLNISPAHNSDSDQIKEIPYHYMEKISRECFMPLAYGGGIKTLEEIGLLLKAGVEKVVLNTHAIQHPSIIKDASRRFGSQCIVISIDTRMRDSGYEVFINGGKTPTGSSPIDVAMKVEKEGAGEIMLTSIDREGTMNGYDLTLLKTISDSVGIPVIAHGGAGKITDFYSGYDEGGASAVAAGSMFVFFGKNRAVLINYPEQKVMDELFIYS